MQQVTGKFNTSNRAVWMVVDGRYLMLSGGGLRMIKVINKAEQIVRQVPQNIGIVRLSLHLSKPMLRRIQLHHSIENVKSFSSHKAHRADLRLLSPQPDTSLHCQTTDTRLVHCAVCLYTSQLSLVLIAPTHGGMARLS